MGEDLSLHKGLNLKGTLTNGLSDLVDIDKDYMVLASAIGPSHVYVHAVEQYRCQFIWFKN